MAQVTVVVNGRSFRMGCRDGEEARVQELAAEIDTHVQQIRGGGPRAVQDDRLFLMAAIVMADQLWDAREELQKLRQIAESRAYHVIDGGCAGHAARPVTGLGGPKPGRTAPSRANG